jgi:hypothetical protein
MKAKDIKEIRTALEIVRKSQNIEFRLRAVITVSAGSGLNLYLQRTKRELVVNLIKSFLKMSVIAIVHAIYSVISKAMFVLHDIWLGITNKSIQ